MFDNLSIPRRWIFAAAGVALVLIIGFVLAFEPVTRNYVAVNDLCTYCHGKKPYEPTYRLSLTSQHPPSPKEGQRTAQCIDCHLPRGVINTAYAYTHFLSFTDLFGHTRDRETEWAGEWLPQAAAASYRVRDRLHEYDSMTCRSCHDEAKIKPKRKRGVNAHKRALAEGSTCIECHDNMVHQFVEVRENAFQKTAARE